MSFRTIGPERAPVEAESNTDRILIPTIHLLMHPSIHSPTYPSLQPPIHASVHLPFHLSTHPSTHAPIYPRIYPSIQVRASSLLLFFLWFTGSTCVDSVLLLLLLSIQSAVEPVLFLLLYHLFFCLFQTVNWAVKKEPSCVSKPGGADPTQVGSLENTGRSPRSWASGS